MTLIPGVVLLKRFLAAIVILPAVLIYLPAAEISISVTDADLDIPLEGVRIRTTGTDEPVFTNIEGQAKLDVPDDSLRNVLYAQLPGYDAVRLPFDPGAGELGITMTMTGYLEGEELVVEGEAPKPDEGEAGVSVALSRKDMDSTANIGINADVMSSVKTLPGVGYTAGYSAEPSIRGGYPEELAITLDGFYVTYPFQWGGSASIFNPGMVESAKLSHGVFSARYGRALSGLLEIETVIPDEPRLRLDGSISSIATDLYLQAPTGDYSGLFLGGKITYMDVLSLLPLEELEGIDPMPYIRNAYGKWNWRAPDSRIELYFNGFIGTDGMGFDMLTEEEDSDVAYDAMFEYWYNNAFLSGGVGWALNDLWRLDLVGGYNSNVSETEWDIANTGTVEYSQAYLDEYDGDLTYDPDGDDTNNMIDNSTSFSVDGLDDEGRSESRMQQGQMKLSLERLIGESNLIAFGVEEVLGGMTGISAYDGWFDYWDGSAYYLYPYEFNLDVEGNKSLNSAAFLLWEFGLSRQSRLSGELGIRGEHYYVWNDDFDMISQPVASPRFSITWRAMEKRKELNHLDLTLGSGIFANTRLESTLASADLKLETADFLPDRLISTVLGMEAAWRRGWAFSLEGYYKYYLNRMVLTGDDGGDGGDAELNVSSEGKGHVAGFDLMLRKKIGRKLDGYLSYSFIYARYFNPSITGNPWEEDYLNYEPLDTWFYPYYHRFHNLNLVLNWYPWNHWTFSFIGSLATGAPRTELGDVESYPAEYPLGSGTYIERYSRTSMYSDSLRNGVSVPLDIRIAYGTYLKRKLRMEVFFAIEDILSPLYTPEGNSMLNPVTGEDNDDLSADYTLGIPMFSFGFKVSY